MGERIDFDSTLYSQEAVRAAAEAYAEVATIELSEDSGSITAAISATADYDPATIAHAFANHALHETIARRRQAALDG